ncbi:nitrate reductase molybdenum cofactor assembly chaperone [uncultured Ferrovibrio sp.]|jgi:nitrate reductase delta subunit|uniref:nitrate reductase molybdenum cofactor assembly chaperone n=1 Tax=uncultured Ferrovibrio sp. TaxID=1576913 RepID=UPI00261767FF|nr:nitrate reductase molybdenum cofactor assembly chaperone [uncultured Ferrovibrio sp.]
MRILKALSALLDYPTADLQAALPEIRAIIEIDLKSSPKVAGALGNLVAELEAPDLMALQERFTSLFDRGRSVALHLYEHVHGDSRDRGPAMVALAELYRSHGFEPHPRELPDYLPMLLEFLSQIDPQEACCILRDAAPILALLRDRLEKRHSAYVAVPAALLAIAEAGAVMAPARPADEDDDSFEALDRAWEEAAVTFGPENDPSRNGGCGKASAWKQAMNNPSPR